MSIFLNMYVCIGLCACVHVLRGCVGVPARMHPYVCVCVCVFVINKIIPTVFSFPIRCGRQ